MRLTIALRSGAEIERLHSAAYSFAETRTDGLRPSVRMVETGQMMAAHVLLPDAGAAQAFQTFWTSYRGAALRLAA